MMTHKSITIIIPCYNEQEILKETYNRIKKVVSELKLDPCMLFINDGSTDNTKKILTEIKKDTAVRVINFSRNFGHQAAVTAGINNCKSDLAVILDADLQDPPELIPEMIETLKNNNANVVYAVRKLRKGENFIKKASAKLFYRLLNRFSEIPIPVDTGDFRLIDKNIISEFNLLKEREKYVRGLVFWVGFKQVPFYYEREARSSGTTKYPFKKMIKLATTSILYFSSKPLKMSLSLGFCSVILAIALGIWSILGKLLGYTHADSGWTSIFVLIIFFGGVQLITIGIVGLYLGNLFDEIKKRPEYIIDNQEN